MKLWTLFLLWISLWGLACAQMAEPGPTLQQRVARWVSGEHSDSGDLDHVRMAGDSAALALTGTLSGREPNNEEMGRAFFLLTVAFSEPDAIVSPPDRKPKEALVVLRYLGQRTQDPILKAQIAAETTRLTAQAARLAAAAAVNPLDQVIADYKLADGALPDGLAELSRIPNVLLHLGIEEVLRERLATPLDRSVRFSLHLEHTKVREILDALCEADDRYAWSMDGATIHVYPKARATEKSDFLNFQIERIQLSNVPNPDQALTPLNKLFPGIVGYMELGGSNTYDAPWTVTFEHLTVRQFADRIAEHIGPQSSWVWQGGKDGQAFSFIRGGFHTR